MTAARNLVDRLSPKHRAQIREQLAKTKKPSKPKPLAFGIEFDSKLELDFATWLQAEYYRERISAWRYHALRFQLAPGLTYTPDFLAVPIPLSDRGLIVDPVRSPKVSIYEVKGSWKMKNVRDSRTRLKMAASMFAWLDWYAVTRGDDRDWVFEAIGAVPRETQEE